MVADKEQEAKDLGEAVEARDKSLAELKAELMGGESTTSLGGLEKALTELQKQTAADKEQEAKDLTAVNEQLKGTQSELGAAVDALEQALKQQMAANKDQEAKELSEAVTAR